MHLVINNFQFYQDGATCHVTDRNMSYLDAQFGDRVVSRRPIRGRDWPARSPDLNPCDFFLWGFLKSKVESGLHSVFVNPLDQVYCPRPASLDQLEANIRQQVAALDPAMVSRSILDVKIRCQMCLQAGGGHFES